MDMGAYIVFGYSPMLFRRTSELFAIFRNRTISVEWREYKDQPIRKQANSHFHVRTQSLLQVITVQGSTDLHSMGRIKQSVSHSIYMMDVTMITTPPTV